MSGIPEDIIKASRKAASAIRFLDYDERQAVAHHIVKAIQAERERCAQLAEGAVFCIDGETFPVDYREEIAFIIREGIPSPQSRAKASIPSPAKEEGV